MEQVSLPSSPSSSPVRIKDCIEDLLKFTLESYIDESLEIDLRLSKDYCSKLLKDDLGDPDFHTTDSLEGVPCYPLYKQIASTLHQSITSGAFCRTNNRMESTSGFTSLQNVEDKWNKLILDKGSEQILEAVDFELHVQEPFFQQLKDRQKTIEGRCAVGDYNRIGSGNLILFNKCLVLEVQNVHRYTSFAEMLEAESLAKVLPGVKTIKEGVQIYRKFYTEEKERSNGVLGICVATSAAQPYIALASMLSGLSYGGIGRLLNLVHTVGTVEEALPPPRSTLLSSFMLPNKPNVQGCSLTDGARALAKHVNRSSTKYWGSLVGNDSNKNKIAMNVISHLISHCCWLNVHILPPHEAVFEIRVADGYGARWSKDGTKFIGFLEPYMEEGHLKNWKH